NGECAFRDRPGERWHGGDALGEAGRSGAFIESLSVPVGAFRIPPNEIHEVLPQQLLMLQIVADALRDAGMSQREPRPRAGVIVGQALDFNTTNFHLRWWLQSRFKSWSEAMNLDPDERAGWLAALRASASPPLNAARTLGALGGMIASRIAREFSLGGPSFTVSCDEASGLRSLEIAVRALQQGEMDAVVVGAVDFAGDARSILARKSAATGTGIGEGAAAIVLKRLEDAEADGDRVYGVVRGVGSASPGTDDRAYVRALERAYADDRVDPDTISYIEAHGSGHPADGQAELRALLDAAGESQQPCALGSVKPNIGHTGAAAGLASFVKTALCLYQQIIPPLRGIETRPVESDGGGRFHVPRYPMYWSHDRVDGPRRAGVSAMTPDGECTHVILEEAQKTAPAVVVDRRQPLGARSSALFAVAGDRIESLLNGLEDLERFIESSDGGIECLARSWFESSGAHQSGSLAVALVAADPDGLRESTVSAMRALRRDPATRLTGRDGVFFAPSPLGHDGEIAFVFPGSGNQFAGMGRRIAVEWPEVFRALDAATDRFGGQLAARWFAPFRSSWTDGWEADAAAAIAARPAEMIFGQVTYGIAISDLMRHFGVSPDAVIGYSLGESAGLFALRAWPDRDEMYRRMQASSLFRTDLAGPCNAARAAWQIPDTREVDWTAVVVPKSADVVRPALIGLKHTRLLIVNTPSECVVGGLKTDIQSVIERLGCRVVPLDGVPTVHCDIALQVEAAYRALHDMPTTPPEGVRFYSAVAGRAYSVTRKSAADSITEQAMRGFDFPAVVNQAYEDGVRVFVEIGPQASCTRMIDRILSDRPHFARSVGVRGEDEAATVLNVLAGLISERVPVDLRTLYGCETRALGHAEPTVAEDSGRHVRVSTGTPPPKPGLPRRRIGVADSSRRRAETVTAETAPAVSKLESEYDFAASAVATGRAHDAFLRFSQTATQSMGRALELQGRLVGAAVADGDPIEPYDDPVDEPAAVSHTSPPNDRPRDDAPAGIAFDREQCLEFAVGSIARVLGPRFASVDSHPTRVRLPDEPLMLVDRILRIDGEPASLTSGRIVTEHDVLPGAWYLDGDRAPVCIAVEAGQADLFLSAYLGIDLATRGERAYRLLDAEVTFHRGLPRPGEVIRYEITIDRFVRRGDTYMFFFEFDGTIAGEPMLSMRNGCAGFFTADEVSAAGGIVLKPEELETRHGDRGDDWRELVPMAAESFDDAAVANLREGNLAACFGTHFENLNIQDPLRLPGGRMNLFDRVVELDPDGGRFGLGIIRTEADVHPDDWFLTCHFVDDMVMPGTLMYECCLHTLRFYLLRMGWVGEQAGVRYEPIPGLAGRLKCRGPVTPETRKVHYQVEIKEIGYRPEPYVIADALMFADERRIVRMTDMSIALTGLTRERIEAVWRAKNGTPDESAKPEGRLETRSAEPGPPLFDRDRILAFAIGKPSEAFGEPYRPFDDERRIARLPGPPYQFLDRITEIEPRPWQLRPGGWIEAEYDVPPDAWYFRANRQRSMPFSILLEIALQPCGWLAAYLGSALRSETDLRFRNLGGTAVLHHEVFPTVGTLNTRVRLTDVSEAGGMIIEQFELEVRSGNRTIYKGVTSFGFFSDGALARQIGIRDALDRFEYPKPQEIKSARSFTLDDIAPFSPDDPNVTPGPSAALPSGALRMIDEIEALIPDGGPNGLGFIRGTVNV
ncbi:MAG: beta-ketoacyl synthase N-terminal-like domain-containing protein, partial [Planctomycetota bacterium]|nr:beta-ketoacyl synthase N-terminal-like domain-containing protein [Planctomycetota bacterium]